MGSPLKTAPSQHKMADRFPSLEEFDSGAQTEAQGSSGFEGDDFLSREKALWATMQTSSLRAMITRRMLRMEMMICWEVVEEAAVMRRSLSSRARSLRLIHRMRA